MRHCHVYVRVPAAVAEDGRVRQPSRRSLASAHPPKGTANAPIQICWPSPTVWAAKFLFTFAWNDTLFSSCARKPRELGRNKEQQGLCAEGRSLQKGFACLSRQPRQSSFLSPRSSTTSIINQPFIRLPACLILDSLFVMCSKSCVCGRMVKKLMRQGRRT
jgi:hypothetical protein